MTIWGGKHNLCDAHSEVKVSVSTGAGSLKLMCQTSAVQTGREELGGGRENMLLLGKQAQRWRVWSLTQCSWCVHMFLNSPVFLHFTSFTSRAAQQDLNPHMIPNFFL